MTVVTSNPEHMDAAGEGEAAPDKGALAAWTVRQLSRVRRETGMQGNARASHPARKSGCPGRRRCSRSGRPHDRARHSQALHRPGGVGDPGRCARFLLGGAGLPCLSPGADPPTQFRAISASRQHVVNQWRRMLKRRSQKDGMTCERIERIDKDRLPTARILHPWPVQRFVEGHPWWEPGACIALAGLCAGGAQHRAPLPRVTANRPCLF